MTTNTSTTRKARVAVIELWRGDTRLHRVAIRLRTVAVILAATVGLILSTLVLPP
jgi:hypothetical protein